MIDSLNSVLDRINEIQKRFNIGRNDNKQITPENKNNYFDEEVNRLSEESGQDDDPLIDLINNTAREFAVKNGLPPSLIDAVIRVESNYDPNAVSKKGATGLMQLMPETYKNLGIKNPFNIRENIEGGVSILKNLVDKYEWDLKKALAAYNAGESAVDRNNGIPPYKETSEYVRKVLDVYIDNLE